MWISHYELLIFVLMEIFTILIKLINLNHISLSFKKSNESKKRGAEAPLRIVVELETLQ